MGARGLQETLARATANRLIAMFGDKCLDGRHFPHLLAQRRADRPARRQRRLGGGALARPVVHDLPYLHLVLQRPLVAAVPRLPSAFTLTFGACRM